MKNKKWNDILEFVFVTLGLGFGLWVLSFGFRMLWEIWRNL